MTIEGDREITADETRRTGALFYPPKWKRVSPFVPKFVFGDILEPGASLDLESESIAPLRR